MKQHIYLAHYSVFTDVDDDDRKSLVEWSIPQALSYSTRWTPEWIAQLKSKVEDDVRYLLGDDYTGMSTWIEGDWDKDTRTSMTMRLVDPKKPDGSEEDSLALITFRIMYDAELPGTNDEDPSR